MNLLKQPAYLKELSIRYRKHRLGRKTSIKQPLDKPEKVVALFEHLQNETKETMLAVCLDRKLRVICFEIVAIGSVESIYARTAEALRAPIALNAPSLIIVHNHPSGDPSPSHADNLFTNRLCRYTNELGISFCDHVIIGTEGFYSFSSHGLL